MLLNVNVGSMYVFLVHKDGRTMNIFSLSLHTHTHTHTHIDTHTQTHKDTHICVYIYTFGYMCVNMCVLCVYAHTFLGSFIYGLDSNAWLCCRYI